MSKKNIFGAPIVCADLHVWEPSCFVNFAQIWLDGFVEGTKMYAPIFLIPALLLARKGPKYLLTKTSLEIIRSGVFLATFSSSFAGYMCFFRRFFSSQTKPVPWFAGFLAGWTAIVIERKNRRSELGLYCLNQATEIGFRMMQSRGWIKGVKHGEVMIFMVANAILMYFFQQEPENVRSNIRGLFSGLLGQKN